MRKVKIRLMTRCYSRACFSSYIKWSARLNSASIELSCSGSTAIMPALKEISYPQLVSLLYLSMDCLSRVIISSARLIDVSVNNTMNSSPPRRANTSEPRRVSLILSAKAASALSPSIWPNLSLIDLNSFRSRYASVAGISSRVHIPSALWASVKKPFCLLCR